MEPAPSFVPGLHNFQLGHYFVCCGVIQLYFFFDVCVWGRGWGGGGVLAKNDVGILQCTCFVIKHKT